MSEASANQLLAAYVVREFRDDYRDCAGTGQEKHSHLANCPTVDVHRYNAVNGLYGCDTGCDYVRFEAVIMCMCPGEWTVDYEFGTFGEIAYILEELERRERL